MKCPTNDFIFILNWYISHYKRFKGESFTRYIWRETARSRDGSDTLWRETNESCDAACEVHFGGKKLSSLLVHSTNAMDKTDEIFHVDVVKHSITLLCDCDFRFNMWWSARESCPTCWRRHPKLIEITQN